MIVDATAPPPGSADWPVPFLLDELWLKTRRLLLARLTLVEGWPGHASYRHFVKERRRRGESLRDPLRVALGTDYALLAGESIFGTKNAKVRSKLPVTLSFGAQVTEVYQCLVSGRVDQASPRATELAAMFNLGISLFDLIVDEFPLLQDELLLFLSEERLRTWVEHGPEPSIAERPEHDEVRVVVRLAEHVFRAIHRRAAQAGLQTQARQVFRTMTSAHDAQLRSRGAAPDPQEPEVARTKSVLPFMTMFELAVLFAPAAGVGIASSARTLATATGSMFWLVDDLIDLADDLQTGATNGLRSNVPAGDLYERLQGVLDGGAIEETAGQIAALFTGFGEGLHDIGMQPGDRRELLASLGLLLRGWFD